MTSTQRGTWLALCLLLAAALALGASWYWKQAAARQTSARLLHYLPNNDGSLVILDVAQLRAYGLLGHEKNQRESEYRDFISATGFDFERDLDRAVLQLNGQRNIYLASGRFSWPKLRDYAIANNGRCVDRACSLPASQPGKSISFFPLEENIIAVALAADPFEAAKLGEQHDAAPILNCPASSPAAVRLRPAELAFWAPALSSAFEAVRHAQACLLPGEESSTLSLAIQVANADIAAQFEASFRTLSTNLKADRFERKNAAFHIDWKIGANTLNGLLSASRP